MMRNTVIISLMVVVAMSCQTKKKESTDKVNQESTAVEQEQAANKVFYTKELKLQGITFTVSAAKENGFSKMTVNTSGLEIQEFNEAFDITGSRIVNAEVEDLNSDGSPELLIFTQSDGSGSYGEVYAFSVNNLKSMSQVYFPPVADNEQLNKGYMGHDEFAIVETKLVQRFPKYNDGDSNANPTGGLRQVSYQLVDGEASRHFKEVSVTDVE
ncbi:hypothetical protein KDU71_13215 [Carboxylicivirga sediminis]|uniref:VCBS repeat-containing protein n=1 Tax=Carboxylicivirga sediminis TaxID=2006564 RepID=A0A941F4Y1_9BACT|nr:PliI family lysozyme inhibitor of I-type lysozyme [Carboxylicivirga sediminis]MBR8536527.1 hypothetical protein [Carboxylicivirga sediminis]